MAWPLLQVITGVIILFGTCTFAARISEGTECNPEDCMIEGLLQPSYVTASYEHFPTLRGCISRERTSANQEIHAVIIRGLSTSQRTSTINNTVDVIIKRNSQYNDPAQMIFVLVSTQPTAWRIHSELATNSSLGLFVVSNHSRIDRERRTKLKSRTADLPMNSLQLMTWIRSKWSALTTLMEVDLGNTVTFRLGREPSASEKCENMSLLSNTYISHVEVQDTRGCLARWNEGRDGKDVHVIELLSPSIEHINNSRHNVILDIRSKSRPVTSRHIVLILRSHLPVQWHILTHNLRGTLDIITDQTVDSNGTNTQSFRVAAEPLTSYSGRALVSWTCDKYGPPVSYTKAELANEFSLVVDGGDQLPRSQPKPTTPKVYEHNLVPDVVRDRKLAIFKSMLVWCSKDSISLSIQKRALLYRNMLPSRASFSEAICAAKDNGTNYIFSTTSHACGTMNKTSHDAIVFTNAIVLQWPMRMSNTTTSSSPSHESHDLDVVNPLSITINITCDHPLDAIPEDITSAEPSDVKFRLKLFQDAKFRNEIRSLPAMISEQETVFVEANITADACIRVCIRNCFLETGDSSSRREHRLITNGCAADEYVQWINTDREGQNQHFQFRLRKFWDSRHDMNVRCNLTICTLSLCNSSAIPEVPQCHMRVHPCGRSVSVSTIVASVTSGPIKLSTSHDRTSHETDHTTPGASSGIEILLGKQGPAPSERHVCSQVIQVEGLSTEIVVAIAFTAFVIGILLMASLWCIYVRTGPAKLKSKNGLRSVSTSGDSTPSSTMPITIHQAASRR